MKLRICAAFVLLVSACLAGRTAVYYLGTLTATGATQAVDLPRGAHKHTVEAAVTGSPSACSIQLEGTLDDPAGSPAWFDLSGSQTCTSPAMFHVAEREVRAIRVNLTALSGGTSPAVTIRYMGVE